MCPVIIPVLLFKNNGNNAFFGFNLSNISEIVMEM